MSRTFLGVVLIFLLAFIPMESKSQADCCPLEDPDCTDKPPCDPPLPAPISGIELLMGSGALLGGLHFLKNRRKL